MQHLSIYIKRVTNLNNNSSASNCRDIRKQRARALSAPQSYKVFKKPSQNRVKREKINKQKKEYFFSHLLWKRVLMLTTKLAVVSASLEVERTSTSLTTFSASHFFNLITDK